LTFQFVNFLHFLLQFDLSQAAAGHHCSVTEAAINIERKITLLLLTKAAAFSLFFQPSIL